MHRVATHLVIVVALGACARGDAAQADALPRAIPVEVAAIEVRPFTPSVAATGTLGGKEEVSLSFKIGGVISRILVDEGASVSAGQVLAELSPVEISSEVAVAQQGQQKAERDLARIRALYADSVVTTEQLQDATTAAEVAQHNLRIAQFNRDFAVIRAPAAGLVLRRLAEPNQMVTPGTILLRVRTNRRGLVLRAGLPDGDVVRVHVGDEAVITFDALPDAKFRARVSQIAPASTPGSGTYEVEVALDEQATTLATGLVGRAVIATRTIGRYPVVPVEALVEAEGDSASIFVVALGSNRGVRRRVAIAQLYGSTAVVSAGVQGGERVVVRGAAFIDEDTRLIVRGDSTARPEPR